MLYHHSLHEELQAVRERELARRSTLPGFRHGSGASQLVRHAAASLLRRVADRLDPQARRSPSHTGTMAEAGR
jgi:hypothetical protein